MYQGWTFPGFRRTTDFVGRSSKIWKAYKENSDSIIKLIVDPLSKISFFFIGNPINDVFYDLQRKDDCLFAVSQVPIYKNQSV